MLLLDCACYDKHGIMVFVESKRLRQSQMKVMLQFDCRKKIGRPEIHTNDEDEGSGCVFSEGDEELQKIDDDRSELHRERKLKVLFLVICVARCCGEDGTQRQREEKK
ncbi:unnamed protein product [Vicia faba]|uniref:Uncharacterized protein n=1 Tax=Vicia faba TaxID=3906 RepID=A0AAV1AVJ7_VICFA|nr:unnamed protein product [Vicia faba]